jgi:hypothetical protein
VSQPRLLSERQLPPAQPKARGGNRPYRRGAVAERQLLHDLQAAGDLAVRLAGSAGPYDLYVLLPGGGRLLQVKLCSASPTEGQIGRWLAALPEVPSGWTAELWYRTPRGWQAIVKDAGTVPAVKEQAS